jgi:uncharacterized protein
MTRQRLGRLVVLLVVAGAGCAGLPRGNKSSAVLAAEQPPAKPPNDPLAKLERSLLFYPVPSHGDSNRQPMGLDAENAHFQSADGTKLHGWYLRHPDPRAVVLFCHGNAGNISHRAGLLKILHQRVGVSAMIFDYRGYGHSEGTPTEAGVMADARAARKWLAQRAGIAEDRIVLMGRSIGGAVAVDLASSDGAVGLVLESTFSSVPDVAAKLYPLLPVRLLMRSKFDSAAKIGRYHGPLLQSHGDADRVVPYKLGRRLHAAANSPKQFVVIPGGDHNDPQTTEYYDALVAFLDSLP